MSNDLYTSCTINNMRTLSATEARNNFFEILNTIIFNGEEIDKVLVDLRKVFAKSKKRKYWSVLDTLVWFCALG